MYYVVYMTNRKIHFFIDFFYLKKKKCLRTACKILDSIQKKLKKNIKFFRPFDVSYYEECLNYQKA